MKRFFTILLSLSLLTGCATKIDRPTMDLYHYLYEVKDDNNNTLYILGAIDLGPTFEAKEGKFQEVYEKCDTIVFETVQNYTDEQQKLYDAFYNDVSMSVEDEIVLNSFLDSNAFFSVYAKTENSPIYNYNIHRFLNFVVETLAKPKMDFVRGVTNLLNSMATIDGKKIDTLQSFDETLNLYYRLNDECDTFIVAALSNTTIPNDIVNLAQAYASGTVDESITSKTTFDLLNLDISFVPEECQTDEVKAQFEVYKQYKQQNISNEKIDELLALNDALLVYDVCVLERENGLIDQLKASGYQVTNLHE